MKSKKKNRLSSWLLGILILLALIVLWGNRIEPRRLDISHQKIELSRLPAHLDGIKLAFLSDFQVGMWLGNEDFLPEVIEKIKDESPDAVLIGGDFIYHPTEDEPEEVKEEWGKDDIQHTKKLIDQVTRQLEPLIEANIPVYAVLGNHDYSMAHSSAKMVEQSALYLESSLEDNGIEVLRNEAVSLDEKSDQLYLVGIAPHYPDLDDIPKALSEVPENALRVYFMHNANSLKDTSAEQIDLAVAGHTHGGQIRVPGLPAWSWMSLVPQAKNEVKGDGWIRDYKGQDKLLYINRGIGFSSIPLRINCPPELTIFTLNAAPSAETL